MNRELFKVREHELANDVLHYFATLGIAGAPVVDAQCKLIGFVSWRDLFAAPQGDRVGEHMSAPVDTIAPDALIQQAARRLCDDDRHHMIVVDDNDNAIGFVGSLDILRGLTGEPVRHPSAFPHWDPELGLPWTNEERLDIETTGRVAPEGPGLFVLIRPRPGDADEIVWSEATVDVRKRLLEFLTEPLSSPPHLADLIEHRQLWFRAAHAPSLTALETAIDRRPRAAR